MMFVWLCILFFSVQTTAEKRASGAVGGHKWTVSTQWCVPNEDTDDIDHNHLNDDVLDDADLINAIDAKEWVEAVDDHYITTTYGIQDALSHFVYTVRVAPIEWNVNDDNYVVDEDGVVTLLVGNSPCKD